MHNSAAATANGSLVAGFKTVTAPNAVDGRHHHQAAAGQRAQRRDGHPDRAGAHLEVQGQEDRHVHQHDHAGRRLRAVRVHRIQAGPERHPHRQQVVLRRGAEVPHADPQLLRQLVGRGRGAAQRRGRRRIQWHHRHRVEVAQARARDQGLPERQQRLVRGRGQQRGEDPLGQADGQRQPAAAQPGGAPRDRDRHQPQRARAEGRRWHRGRRPAPTSPPAFPQWYWTPPASQAQNYDPAKANAMLTAAGFPKGKNGYRYDKKTGKELSFRLGIHSDYRQRRGDRQLPRRLDEGHRDQAQRPGDEQHPAQRQPRHRRLGPAHGPVGRGRRTRPTCCRSRPAACCRSTRTAAAATPTRSSATTATTSSTTPSSTEFNLAKREADIKAMEKILYNADDDIILYDGNYLWATRTSYVKGYVYGTPNAQGLYPLQNYELGWIKAVPAREHERRRWLELDAHHRDRHRRRCCSAAAVCWPRSGAGGPPRSASSRDVLELLRTCSATRSRSGSSPRRRSPRAARRGGTSPPTWRRKLVAALVSLIAVVVIAFILFSIIPSNPVRTLTQGRPVSAAELAHAAPPARHRPADLHPVLALPRQPAAPAARLLLPVPRVGLLADRPADRADAAADGHLDAHLDRARAVARDPQRLERGQPLRQDRLRGRRWRCGRCRRSGSGSSCSSC